MIRGINNQGPVDISDRRPVVLAPEQGRKRAALRLCSSVYLSLFPRAMAPTPALFEILIYNGKYAAKNGSKKSLGTDGPSAGPMAPDRADRNPLEPASFSVKTRLGLLERYLG